MTFSLALTFYSLSTLSSLVISTCLVTLGFILSPDLSSQTCPCSLSIWVMAESLSRLPGQKSSPTPPSS